MANPSSVELLAPAGNWECARAAIENGADAIYFGLESGFNARARAANFHLDDLDQLMLMLHRQGVKGYVTLNTLIFTDELPDFEISVRRLSESGVNAVLVQDLGAARLIREICPELEVHSSTQMTLTHAESIELARELGVQRVVLARELSVKEISKVTAATDMPVEVFVHGALCVAYSGQCLTSESFGGRSANRGQCAQACRLPYDLYCDGEARNLGNVRYLLSPQDLAAHDLVPQLIEAGVCSLKVEGRLKTPEYVANVCSQYRSAIDSALRQQPKVLSEQQQRDLEMSFSRGFSPGWLEGCDHKRLVPGTSSAKRGVLLGTVNSHRGDRLQVQLDAPLSVGDGVVLEGDRFACEEIGGRVFELLQRGEKLASVDGGTVEVGLPRGILDRDADYSGLKVFKTDDPQLTKRLRRSFEGSDPKKRILVDFEFYIEVGKPIELKASTADGASIKLQNEHCPEAARKHPISLEKLTEQMSRLGGTVYRMGDLSATIEGEPMVPLSVLGGLRRQCIEALDEARVPPSFSCSQSNATQRMLVSVAEDAALNGNSSPAADEPRLRVLCRTLTQLEHVLQLGVRDLIVDFHDIREYHRAVAASHEVGAHIELATLRIHKPGEDGLFKAMAKHGADGWLVRNLAAVKYCQQEQIPMSGDFSLNVTNPLTAQQLRNWGIASVTASYDLNRDQLLELAEAMPSDWLEVVIHQHMPMFHMEHCVFCSVLSPGKNKSDCGRPCDRHEVQLGDRTEAKHVLHADIGCRNTLYNGTAQSGAEAVKPLLEQGVRHFRIEMLRDAEPVDIKQLVELYQKLIAGQLSGTQVWQQLKAHNRVGVTRGTLEQPRNPLAIL